MTITSSAPPLLIFTDLDGSLLDHYDYGFRAALGTLARLEQLLIPVIANSSKTRAEIEHLRKQMGNAHPFIAENGAAVFIPVGYFPEQPAQTVQRDGYWVRAVSPPRSVWIDLLQSLEGQFRGDFDYFYQLGNEGIAALTGLALEEAALANQREYSEPVAWSGSAEQKVEFLAQLADGGASALQGGRFLGVSGDCDKGKALTWLREQYCLQGNLPGIHDLAIGDSGNDIAMLQSAETALVIRSPAHGFPKLERRRGVIYSEASGPAGWAEGVATWLQNLGH